MMKMDWETGIWSIHSSSNSADCRVTICSDWAPIRAFHQLSLEDPLALYGDLLPSLRENDLSIVNVEGVLGPYGKPIPKAGPNLRIDERAIRSLIDVPFHVACLANNHTFDFGIDGLEYTLNLLQEAGLQTLGAGLNGKEAEQPLIVTVKSICIGIINCAEGEACRSVENRPGVYGLEFPKIVQQIKTLKRKTDVIIVMFHGGREHVPLPPAYVVDAMRNIAEAGATAVIGNHPHVPQGLEMHQGVPIIYSQGNFVFWHENDLFYRHTGYLVHLDIDKNGVSKLELTPYMIERDGLSLMKEKQKKQFLLTLQRVSEYIQDTNNVREVWNAFTDLIGVQRMMKEMETLISGLDEDTRTNAAKLQNLFFTPAHRELYSNGLKRLSNGEVGNAPQWASALVEHWLYYSIKNKENGLNKLEED